MSGAPYPELVDYTFNCEVCGGSETRQWTLYPSGKPMGGSKGRICRSCKLDRKRATETARRRARGIQPRKIFWTSELIERVKALWNSGLSATKVGSHFGVSRCAILGLLGRLGLLGKRSKITLTEAQRKRSRLESVRRYRAKKSLNFARKPKAAPLVSSARANGGNSKGNPSPELLPPLNISLIEIKRRQCRYPYGDRPFTFCGHHTKDGSSYCEHHHRIAYVRTNG